MTWTRSTSLHLLCEGCQEKHQFFGADFNAGRPINLLFISRSGQDAVEVEGGWSSLRDEYDVAGERFAWRGPEGTNEWAATSEDKGYLSSRLPERLISNMNNHALDTQVQSSPRFCWPLSSQQSSPFDLDVCTALRCCLDTTPNRCRPAQQASLRGCLLAPEGRRYRYRHSWGLERQLARGLALSIWHVLPTLDDDQRSKFCAFLPR